MRCLRYIIKAVSHIEHVASVVRIVTNAPQDARDNFSLATDKQVDNHINKRAGLCTSYTDLTVRHKTNALKELCFPRVPFSGRMLAQEQV